MSANKFNNVFSKLGKNSKGIGAGASALLIAGGLLYGATQSIFTGITYKVNFIIINNSIL
jgi:hypothetical protein